MRKVICSMSVSLDGFIETPDRKLDWVIVDEELHSFWNTQAREQSAFLYGRRMYELMAAYWPSADTDPSNSAVMVEFSRIWKDKPKVVFSRTLKEVAWKSRLVQGDLAGEVARLKAQPGSEMGVGGAALAASFTRLGLIDEYQLFVNPVILGAGTPFFPALDRRLDLRLVEARNFSSGVVYLRYQQKN